MPDVELSPAWELVGLWMVVVNVIAFLTFGWDKHRASRGERRVSEAHLLWLAFLLGAPGAWLGIRAFHHKTVKKSFRIRFALVTLLEVVLIGAVAWWTWFR